MDLLLITLVRRAMQEPELIVLHVTPLPTFIHIMEAIVGILVRTGSGEAMAPLGFVCPAIAVEVAHSAARLAMEEQVALVPPALRGPFFLTESVFTLVLQDTGETRKQMLVSRATALAQLALDQRVMNVSPVILDTFTLDSVSLLVLLDTINIQRQTFANLAG